MAKIIIEGPEFFLQRRKEKKAARASDQARLDTGEDPTGELHRFSRIFQRS